jgi:hypothetical protein
MFIGDDVAEFGNKKPDPDVPNLGGGDFLVITGEVIFWAYWNSLSFQMPSSIVPLA